MLFLVFVMTIAGGFEVTNGYGPKLAPQVMWARAY